MADLLNQSAGNPPVPRSLPPGGIKIAEAFKLLLAGKDFADITIEDIVNASGVNAALIYKYYGDKRGLLHQLLSEGLDRYVSGLERELKGIKGAFNKLRKLTWLHFNLFRNNRVVARIILLEVRNHRSFYKSDSYEKIRQYNAIVKSVIEEGVQEGEIRSDIPVWVIRQSLMGAIEHLCMPWVISGLELSEDEVTENLCSFFFRGIEAVKKER